MRHVSEPSHREVGAKRKHTTTPLTDTYPSGTHTPKHGDELSDLGRHSRSASATCAFTFARLTHQPINNLIICTKMVGCSLTIDLLKPRFY